MPERHTSRSRYHSSTNYIENPTSNKWIYFAIGGAICAATFKALISGITSSSGFEGLFYNTTGSIVLGIFFNLVKAKQHYNAQGEFWSPQNLRVQGKTKHRNVVGFIAYCLAIACTQISIYTSIFFAKKA